MTGTVFKGPEATGLFRLLSLRQQLKLEALGLRSSGGPIRPRIAKEFGLKPRDSYAKYQAAIGLKIQLAQSVLPPDSVERF